MFSSDLRIVFVLVPLVLLSGCIDTGTPDNASQRLKETPEQSASESRTKVYKAEVFGEYASVHPDSFHVNLSPSPIGPREETSAPRSPNDMVHHLAIGQRGQVRCEALPESGSFTLKIDHPEKDVVEGVSYSVFDSGDVLLVYEFGDIESGATGLARVRSNCSLIWSTRLSGFNPGPHLIYEGSVYATVIGRVARIDAQSGTVTWMHGDLYQQETGAFNSFQQPRMFEDLVFFPDRRDPERRVVVARETGKLISRGDA